MQNKYTPIGAIILCDDKKCGKKFIATDRFEEHDILPCGHEIGQVIFCGKSIKDAMDAEDRLESMNCAGGIDKLAEKLGESCGGTCTECFWRGGHQNAVDCPINQACTGDEKQIASAWKEWILKGTGK